MDYLPEELVEFNKNVSEKEKATLDKVGGILEEVSKGVLNVTKEIGGLASVTTPDSEMAKSEDFDSFVAAGNVAVVVYIEHLMSLLEDARQALLEQYAVVKA